MLACPYCYERFEIAAIKFRCTGRLSPAGRRCESKRDETMYLRIGRGEALPPVFAADGRGREAVCPSCKGRTSNRVCPYCHSVLPVHFGRIGNRFIAMVGARQTGKTVYMTVLLHELANSLSARLEASLVGADEYTRRTFRDDYHALLYDRNELPLSTPTATARGNLIEPLVFRLSSERRHRLGLVRRPRHDLLSFFDAAGEDFRSEDSVDLNVRYLSAAHGIVLLLDPLQMPQARSLARAGTILPVLNDDDAPLNVLARVTSSLSRLGRPSALVAKPVAVVFSKLDALWHRFPEGGALRRVPPDGAGLDEDDSLAVHAQVQALLHQWGGGQIDQHLRLHYRRYRYFGVSALGESPTPTNQISERGIRPYRVGDPFLWLLSEFSAIPFIPRART